MKRRVTGKRRSGKRRRAFAPEARKAPSTVIADLREQLDRRTQELDETLRQKTATSEVLSIIRQSPTDTQPVFDAIVESAARLCDAVFSVVYLYEGGQVRIAATRNFSPDATTQMNKLQQFKRPERSHAGGRAILDRAIVHVPDVLADPEYSRELALAGGWRAVLAVPLLRKGAPVGALTAAKAEAKPFSDQQIQLLNTFADQALIAIENARLLNELRESLQQQTATADVLKVISRSAFDLQTVLDTLVESAVRLCEADTGILRTREGEIYPVAATYRLTQQQRDRFNRYSTKPDRGSLFGRAVLEGRTIHVSDVLADPEYDYTRLKDLQDVVTVRAGLAVPMMREGTVVGIITLQRKEPRPFSDSQIQLVATFADQAVIAIENVRLFDEVQARTRELSESLQQQTATADVLRIISASLGELEPVFSSILQNATRICEAKFGTLYRFDGRAFYHAAGHGTPDALIEVQRRQGHFVPEAGTLMHRVMHTKDPAHSADYAAESALGLSAKFGGARSTVVVPMLKDNELVGAFAIYRQEVRPFTEKQIALLKNFAAQAVIAIENARLLNELRQRTHELSASLDNLRATQDRLVQTEKMASLGQLTAGIAHEMKNPLNFVNNFSGVSAELVDDLQEALKDSSPNEKRRSEIAELMNMLRSNLDKVVQHGKRADGIVKSMLLHSGESSGQQQTTDINALVEESLNRAYYAARAEQRGFAIKLERSFDPAAGSINLFPRELTRALLNLISNGFYAATKRKADANGDDYEPTLAATTKNLGNRVEIRIRDNGTGIPADVKEKMFNPFFTTKPPGEGTGLGLSISYDIIVKQHGGSIEVDTKPGAFAEIRVILPRSSGVIS